MAQLNASTDRAKAAGEPDELVRLFHEVASPSIPAYRRVKLMIDHQIRNGIWVEGQRVPSENELVDALGLSRMTINRAYRELSSEGLLDRHAGLGSFVADTRNPSPLLQVKSIAEEVRQRGRRHRLEVVFVRSEDGEPSHLPVTGGADTLFHSLVIHFSDDEPIQLEDRFVNPAAAPEYLMQDFTSRTPHEYLMAVAPLTRGEHVVEAVTAGPSECEHLGIQRDEPCLLVRRRTWSGETLVTVARLLYPGSKAKLEGTFTT